MTVSGFPASAVEHAQMFKPLFSTLIIVVLLGALPCSAQPVHSFVQGQSDALTVAECTDSTGSCDITVSVTPLGDDRCAISVNPEIVLLTGRQQKIIRWKIDWDSGLRKKIFRFERSKGVNIAQPLNRFDNDTHDDSGTQVSAFTWRRLATSGSSLLGRNYNISVQRLVADDAGALSWRFCGQLDPIIVNRE